MSHLKSGRILYMEDEPDAARFFQEKLEPMAYLVDIVATGEEGLARCETTTYDLVVVSQNIPGHGGLEMIRRLANRDQLPPMVILLNPGEEQIAVEALKSGASDYIVKDSGGGYLELLPWVIERVVRQWELIKEKQQAQEAIRQLEQRYQNLFQEAPVMYVLTRNQDGAPIIADCNQLFLITLGYDRSEVLEQPLADFYTPESQVQLLERGGYQQALAGDFMDQERDLIARDGRIVKSLLRAVPEIDADGQVIGTRAMYVDITERKQAEEERIRFTNQLHIRQKELRQEKRQAQAALRESEERFRAIFELAPIGMIIAAETGQFLQTNKFLQQMLGYSERQLHKMTLKDIIHPDELAESLTIRQQLAAPQAHQAHFRQERRYRRKDGRLVWSDTTVFAIYDANGNFQHTITLIQDITERKRAEEALRESENRYKTLFDTAPVAIYTKDRAGCYTSANTDTLTYWAQNPIGHTDAELLTPEIATALRAADVQVMETGQELILEEKIQAPHGLRILLSRKMPLRDAEGNIIGILGTSLDITERKQAEEALRQSEERFRRVISSISDHIYVTEVTADGRHLNRYLSPHVTTLTGYPHQKFMDDWRYWPTVVIHPDDRPAAAAQMERLAMGQNSEVEYHLVRANGEIIWVRDSARVEVNGTSKIIYGVVSDITERKRAEEALRESENRYQTLTELAPVGIFRTDIRGDYVYINERWTELTGLVLAEAFGQGWAQALHADDRESVVNEWYQCAEEKRPFKLECRFMRSDGVVTWVLVQATTEKNSNGAVLGYVGTVTDITERKQAEEDIVWLYQAERARYREAEALRQAALALVSTIDLDQVIERILAELHNVVPYDSASVQLLQGNHLKIIGGRGFPNLSEVLGLTFPIHDNTPNTRVLEFQEPVIVDDLQTRYPAYAHGPLDGTSIRSWLGTPLRIGERTIGVLTLNKEQADFYTRAHAETALVYAAQAAIAIENARLHAETERRAQQLAVLHELDRAIAASRRIGDVYDAFARHADRLLSYESMSITLLEGDELRVTYVAGADKPPVGARQPLAASAASWVVARGQPLLRHNIGLDMRFAGDEELIAAQIQSAMVIPLRVKRQVIGTWNINNRRLGAYSPDDLEIAQSMADQLAMAIENARLYQQAKQEIVERKQAQEALEAERASLAQRIEERTAELQLANAELARASRLKDEFLASMSHELRTPLNAILGMSEVLQENVFGTLNEKQMKPVRIIEESGRHLLSLIDDILDLSKIGAGKLKLDIGPIFVEQICQASLQFIKLAAHKKKITVSPTYDSSIKTLQADERRLKQILVNLLSNAVKFTPEEGAIGLNVVGDPLRQVIHFTVWDSGIGIAQEDLGRLFQPFVQLDSRLSRQYAGTGLGLSLVYRLTEMHGGSVSAESKPGQGSRFTVSLPWQPVDEGPATGDDTPRLTAQISEPVAINHQPAAVVLLAEDNEANIATVSSFLLAKDYQVVVARDGAEALELAQQKQPDVVLMDIQMPKVDGLEAVRLLRADPHLATIPIIALTALAMPGDRERCLAAGANEYLSKPVSLKELARTIEAQLENRVKGIL